MIRPERHEGWEACWLRHRPYNARKLERYFRVFDIDSLPKDSRILDIGAGLGDSLRLLMARGFHDVRGIEPNRVLLGLAGDLPMREGSCLDPGWAPPGSFDCVLIFGVLHHLGSRGEVETALRGAFSLLRKGGFLCCVEPRPSIIRRAAMAVLPLIPVPRFFGYASTAAELMRLEGEGLRRWFGIQPSLLKTAEAAGFKSVFIHDDWRCAFLKLRK
ncbi:MAG: class I SAM-dependent methyltransferase [Elusimicrobia bacterium]|nr:class I SAM-dependent methyltransferase [Elusimicrobiota bacterium]